MDKDMANNVNNELINGADNGTETAKVSEKMKVRTISRKKRKDLIEQYRQMKTYMGVIKITNKTNGKIFIASFPNLKNKWIAIQSQLNMNMHCNSQLQKDWNELGPDAFTYEVLEEKEADDVDDVKWELKQMLKPWLEKLQPYGEKGYNKPMND